MNNTIQKDSFENSVHKRSQKKRVSFADNFSPSQKEQLKLNNRKLVEVVNIDSYKSFNTLHFNDEDQQHQSQPNEQTNTFITFDDETNYTLHNSSEYGNTCIIV